MEELNGNLREYKLDNGLVVALQNTPTKTISAKLRVNYGASHELEGEEGMAHFLEHCLFTGGSEKYDSIRSKEIDGEFGYTNASTNIGRTFFVGDMLSGDLELWLDYVSNMTLKPRFDEVRVNEERGRVLSEISDKKSDPNYPRAKEFREAFYGKHPKKIFVLGKESVVRDADYGKISKFHSRGYSPNNMDLILVGGIGDDTVELVESYFGSASRGENTRREFPMLRPLDSKVELYQTAMEMLNQENPQMSSTHISFTFNTPDETHQDTYATRTMSHVLGCGTNSLLFKNVSAKLGLYSSGTSGDGSYNAGEMTIGASVPANICDETIDAIFGEVERIKTELMDDKTVERIKKLSRYYLANTYESNKGHVSMIETKLDYGLTPEDINDGFNAVTPEKVREVAQKYLPDRENGKYVLVVRGPKVE